MKISVLTPDSVHLTASHFHHILALALVLNVYHVLGLLYVTCQGFSSVKLFHLFFINDM